MQSEKEIEKELGEGQSSPTTKRQGAQEEAFMRLALKRYDEGVEYYGPAIGEMRKKKNFVDKGNHWPKADKDRRADAGLICIEHNYAAMYRDNIVGSILQSMPQGKITGFDGGKLDKKLGSIGTSILRRIEGQSYIATLDRDTVKNIATTGYPDYQEIYHTYPDSMAVNQEMFVRRFKTQESVILDPHGNRDIPDRGGRMWGFVIEDMRRSEYERRWPKSQNIDFKDSVSTDRGWWADKSVRIAGYYNVEPAQETIVLLSVNGQRFDHGVVKDGDEHKLMLAAASKRGDVIGVLKERKNVTVYQINHYIINSREILEGPEEVLFDRIPVVEFEGKYTYDDDGRKSYVGVFDYAMDALLLLDLWSSEAAQKVMTGEQVMATAKMIPEALKEQWEKRVGEKVLIYEPDDQVPGGRPVEVQTQANTSQIMQMLNIWSDIVKDLGSIHEASLGAAGPQASGRAQSIRQQADARGHYELVANIEAAIDTRTRIIRSGIARVYDYEMMVRIVGDDGRPSGLEVVNQPMPDTDGEGNVIQAWINNLKVADFDTEVSTGPSFKTRSAEAAAYLADVGAANPELGVLLGDLSLRSMDFAYADEAGNRVKAYINIKFPGLLESIEGDENQMEAAKIKQAVEQAVQQLQESIAPGIEQSAATIEQITAKLQEQAQIIQTMEAQIIGATGLMKNKDKDYEFKEREMQIKEAEMRIKEAERQPPPDYGPAIEMLKKQIEMIAETTATVMEQHLAMIENRPGGTDASAARGITDMLQAKLAELKAQLADMEKAQSGKPVVQSVPQPITVIVDNKGGTIRKTFDITKQADGHYRAEGTEEAVD